MDFTVSGSLLRDLVGRDVSAKIQPSPKCFIFGGFTEKYVSNLRFQGFFLTPKTLRDRAIQNFAICTRVWLEPTEVQDAQNRLLSQI